MADRTQPLTPPWPTDEALMALLDELRLAGYQIGVDQYSAVPDLLLALAERGAPLADPRDLRRYLGPLLCSNATEQSDFVQRFDHWLTRLGVAAQVSATEQATALARDLGEIAEKRRWLEWAGLAALALVIGLAIYLYFNPPTTIFPVTAAPPTPTATLAPTATLSNIAPGVGISSPLTITALTSVTTGLTTTATVATPTVAAPIATAITTTTQRSWWDLLWPILAALLAALAIWQAWWYYQARLFLVRRSTTAQPSLTQIAVAGVTDGLFATMPLLRLAQEFRRRISTPSAELDVERTLAATLAQGNWFTPVYGSRLTSPEYLVLVDRTTYRDQQASFVNAVIEQLAQQNVYLTTYYFEGDPRLCFSPQRRTRPLSLQELATQHAGQRLLLFADAERLFSPVHGTLEAWLELFAAWPRRALMTPEPPEHWGQWEQEAREHFAVLPASADGLARFVRSLQSDLPADELAAGESAPLPSELRTRPRRWLQRDPVEPALLTKVLAELRRYLGAEGYYWLSACAIYPELHWHLTLYLGQVLLDGNSQPIFAPPRLLALARLPWFRHGSMPDWLRTRLVADLPRDQERTIRSALQTLLASAVQGEASGLTLTIARRYRHTLAVLSGPLLRLLGRQAPADSPLRDYVFLNFMAGWWRTQLAVRLPLGMQRRLGERTADEQVDWWEIGRFGLSWFLTNLAGGMLGVVSCVIYTYTIGAILGVPDGNTVDVLSLLFFGGLNGIFTFFFSIAQQALIKRRYISQLSWGSSGLIGGLLAGGFLVPFANYVLRPFGLTGTSDIKFVVFGFTIYGMLWGISVGGAQWYGNRKHIPHFVPWIWASTLGMGLLFGGFVAVLSLGIYEDYFAAITSNSYFSFLTFAILLAPFCSALYSVPTGIVLYRAIAVKHKRRVHINGAVQRTLAPLSVQAQGTVSFQGELTTVVNPPLASEDPQTRSAQNRVELIIALRNLLAEFYPEEASTRILIADSGIDPTRIMLTGAAVNNWHNILIEAEKANKVTALLDVVLTEYGNNPRLRDVVIAYQRSIQSDYIAQVEGRARGRIWWEPQSQLLYLGQQVLDNLAPKEADVLAFLVNHPGERHTYTDLIKAVWSDEEHYHGVSNDLLFQVIKRLRRKIEPDPAQPVYVVNWRGKPEGGYIFFPDGRPS